MRWFAALKKHGARLLLGALLTVLAACASIGLFGVDTLGRLDAMLGDMRMRLEAPQLDTRIVIVDIDDASLQQLGQWP